jgi:hypothetical protein
MVAGEGTGLGNRDVVIFVAARGQDVSVLNSFDIKNQPWFHFEEDLDCD